jgi:hypothetical protein
MFLIPKVLYSLKLILQDYMFRLKIVFHKEWRFDPWRKFLRDPTHLTVTWADSFSKLIGNGKETTEEIVISIIGGVIKVSKEKKMRSYTL